MDVTLCVALIITLAGLCILIIVDIFDTTKLIKKIEANSIAVHSTESSIFAIGKSLADLMVRIDDMDADTTKALHDLQDAVAKLESESTVNGKVELEVPSFPKLTTELKSLTTSMNKLSKAVEKK